MTHEAAKSKMRKIRALLTQAEDPSATAEEAAAFSAKAFELMAQHGIEMAMLEAEDDAYGSTTTPEARIFEISPPWALNGARLLNSLSNALRCRAIRLRDKVDGKKKIMILEIFGFESDLNRLDVLYTSLLLQMHTGLATAQREKPHHEHGRAFNQSWMMGFISEVAYRVRQAENYAAEQAVANNETADNSSATPKSTALVLTDRSKKVDQAFAKAYPRVSKGNHSSTTGSGYGSGQRAGERADIGQTKVSGRSSIGR